jgi:hypothetical protein
MAHVHKSRIETYIIAKNNKIVSIEICVVCREFS